MPVAGSKTIHILLTNHTDNLSRIIGVLTGSRYTHVSIGLEDGETFFSFNTKRGFCIEKPFSKIRNNPCILYQLDVTEQIYNDISQRIQTFVNCEEGYKYNFIGTLFCILRLPLWRILLQSEDKYFCSQFVSEILFLSGAAMLDKPPARFLPKHFCKVPQFRLCYKGDLTGLM